jgi:hypothetical protein
VHEVRDQCCRFIQKEAHSGFFGLYLIVRENSTIQQERYLDDDEKFLDVLN